MTFTAQESRVDALIRLVAIIILLFGLLTIYQTDINTASITPAIATLNYTLGAMLLIVGGYALIAKFK